MNELAEIYNYQMENKTIQPSNISNRKSEIVNDENDLINLYNVLSNLEKEQNNLILRISGVTRVDLLEELQEEYEELCQHICLKKSEIDAYETEQKKYTLEKMVIDTQDFYTSQFKKTNSLVEALDITNKIDMMELCKVNRLRPISTYDRHKLCTFATMLKRKIVILDLENIQVDLIGNPTHQELKLYLYCMSTYEVVNYNLFGIPL